MIARLTSSGPAASLIAAARARSATFPPGDPELVEGHGQAGGVGCGVFLDRGGAAEVGLGLVEVAGVAAGDPELMQGDREVGQSGPCVASSTRSWGRSRDWDQAVACYQLAQPN